MLHFAEFQFAGLQIRRRMTRGEVAHSDVQKTSSDNVRDIRDTRCNLTRTSEQMPGSTCVSVRAGTCDTSPFSSSTGPSFLHRLMDFNESRGMSATNEGKVVGRQTPPRLN